MTHERWRSLPVRPWCVTSRSDLRCLWCVYCRGANGRDHAPGDPSQPPFPDGEACRFRLVGGDTFTQGDLGGWIQWARRAKRSVIEVEGHGHHLADEGTLERLHALGVDALRVLLPTLDDTRMAAWTGVDAVASRTLRGIDLALDAGFSVTAAVAVNAVTAPHLVETVTGLAARYGDRVEVELFRAPPRGGPRAWDELDALGAALSSLPDPLPNGLRLRFDALRGYGPCVLPPAAWRRGLVTAYRSGTRALAHAVAPQGACASCAWQPRCAWQTPGDDAPGAVLRPLAEGDVRALQRALEDRDAARAPRTDARAYGLPDLLCFAPFTSMAIHELRNRPVPCAQAWVDTTSSPEMEARELGLRVDEIHEMDRAAQARWGVPWHDVMNEDYALRDVWNAPLLMHMRRQMLDGGPTDRCRSSCRVVLGVEERGVSMLTRPDDELDPVAAANRRLLLDDMRERRVKLRALPLDLCVGVASHCNISCGFCTGPGGRYGELSDRRYDEVVALLPTMLQLAVVGPGEPLMSAGFNRLLGHIADRGYPSLSVAMTTNGTLLRKSWVERHRDVRWGMLRVSLNAGSARSYLRMTGKEGYFERALEGVELLATLRETRRDTMQLVLSCVLSTNVLGDLSNFAAIVHRFGATPVLEPMTGDLNGNSPYKSAETIRALGEECRAVAEEYAVKNPAIARAFAAMEQFSEERTRKRLNVILPRW